MMKTLIASPLYQIPICILIALLAQLGPFSGQCKWEEVVPRRDSVICQFYSDAAVKAITDVRDSRSRENQSRYVRLAFDFWSQYFGPLKLNLPDSKSVAPVERFFRSQFVRMNLADEVLSDPLSLGPLYEKSPEKPLSAIFKPSAFPFLPVAEINSIKDYEAIVTNFKKWLNSKE
jgi:hypothetical protein